MENNQGQAAPNDGDFRPGFFDDEPLDGVLYGNPGKRERIPDIFTDTETVLARIEALSDEDLPARFTELSKFSQCIEPISRTQAERFIKIIKPFFPCFVYADFRQDARHLGPLLDALQELFRQWKEYESMASVGWMRGFDFQHRRMHEEARKVWQKMVGPLRGTGLVNTIALVINNIGCEYLLEGRFRDAIPHFEEGLRRLKPETRRDSLERENILVNLLHCRLELKEYTCTSDEKQALLSAARSLHTAHDVRARKPLYLLARIEDAAGNPASAAKHIGLAIDSLRNVASLATAMDAVYLARLREKMGIGGGES